jgi:hypothetical protein
MIRTTNDVMRSLLFQVSCYWAESIYTTTYILNFLPTKAILAPTPYFALFGTTPSYVHLQVFRCVCYPNTSATALHKLAPHSYRCVFLGYSSDHKGYWCLDLTTNHLLISRHIVYDESSYPFASSDPPPDDLDSFSSSHAVQAIASPYPSFVAGTSETIALPRVAPVPQPAPHTAPTSLPPPRAAPTSTFAPHAALVSTPTSRAAPMSTPVPRAA